MYYSAAISYYFMALEGFVNIIYHAFLEHELRKKELNLKQRFDLEQKILLMPFLCYCLNKNVQFKPQVMEVFKKLKKYRNFIFHSNIEDSLKSICFIEKGFFYYCDVAKYKESFLPIQKIKLKTENVIEVKKIVDNLI